MDLKEHRRKVLRKLNFERTEGAKHEKWTLRDSSTGKVYVTTYVSRGNRDIGTSLIKAIWFPTTHHDKPIQANRVLRNVQRIVLQTFN